MSDILKQVYNACDPFEPATKEFFIDCSLARGSGALTQEFQRRLSLDDGFLRFLFSGHIGCGKSSELADLKRDLEDPNAALGRYFTILVDVSDYLDDYDATPTDILLAIVTEVADALREQANIELKDSYFEKRLNEIKGFFLSDVDIDEGEIKLGEAKVKIQRLKKDPNARQQVRAALLPRMSAMLEEINIVFERARLEVKKLSVAEGQPYKDVVLILDNLEKIQRIAGKNEGVESQRELFVERAPQLTGLDVHVIYTVPLRLARADGPQLKQRYGMDPLVLPMVKVLERGRRTYPKGVHFLKTLLQARVESHKLEDVFEAEALDFLLNYSGGHIRNLMTFVQNACTYVDAAPITLRAAHLAIQQTVRTYSTAIPEHHWEKLARLDASDDQLIANDDKDYLEMLENLSVLEYINGDGADDPFSSVAPGTPSTPSFENYPNLKRPEQNCKSLTRNERLQRGFS